MERQKPNQTIRHAVMKKSENLNEESKVPHKFRTPQQLQTTEALPKNLPHFPSIMSPKESLMQGFNHLNMMKAVHKVSPTAKRTKKAVTFAVEEALVPVDLTSENDVDSTMDDPASCDSTWYTKSEYQSFRKEGLLTMHVIEAATSSGQKEIKLEYFCELGLEHLMDRRRASERRERRQKAIDAVLAEQYEQYINGRCNPKSIAACYENVSGESSREARSLALQVESEVVERKTIIAEDQEKECETSRSEDHVVVGNNVMAHLRAVLPRARSCHGKLARKKGLRLLVPSAA